MTSAELELSFLRLYDKVTNLAAPGYTQDEIQLFLNKAQLQSVKHRYNYKGNKYREGVEATEKRRKDLSELVRGVDISGGSGNNSDQTGVFPNGEFFDLPTDFLYTLMEEITIAHNTACFDGNRIKVKPITHDEYNANVNNPFKKPNEGLAWRIDYSHDIVNSTDALRHEIVTGADMSITTYHVRYIKLPRDIDLVNGVTSELHESMHEEIVDMAVRIATGITDPQSYQIKAAEEKLTE
jgi:hypothetical protein